MQSVQKVDESVDENVGGCSKLARKEYKRRHDNLGKTVHWKLARKCNFEAGDKWYEHQAKSVLENEVYKILWDFRIQTDLFFSIMITMYIDSLVTNNLKIKSK